MKRKIESLRIGSGKIVYNTNDYEYIFCLFKAETIDLFNSSRIVLFRGFGITPIHMEAFSEKLNFRCKKFLSKESIDSFDFVNLV